MIKIIFRTKHSARPGRPCHDTLLIVVLLGICGVASNCTAADGMIDLSDAVVILPPNASARRQKAATMLIEEVEKRSQIHWNIAEKVSANEPSIILGTPTELTPIIPDVPEPPAAEGYVIRIRPLAGSQQIQIIGSDDRGVFFGVGRLLRNLQMIRQKISLASDFSVTSAPAAKLRGHQLGYRPKTNSYDGWTVAMWEQYMRDLIVFGANAIELIPPRSDDASDSPHFTLPPMQMMTRMSQLADQYDLDVWVWYPAMDPNYSDPKTVQLALDEWAAVFSKLSRLDVVFVPGGDPGHTRPKVLFDLLEKQTANLHRFHPKAQMWMSPQSFNRQWFDEYLELLKTNPSWLSGVVYGPEIRLSLHDFRHAIPSRYPIRHYPDITHCIRCQYPVPDWDAAFAGTEGREPINPRPMAMAHIAKIYAADTIGFLAYSEGCNDDVNKAIWSAVGWDEKADVTQTLREFSRYFIGPEWMDNFAQGLLALERNWQGPVASNDGIDQTLAKFQAMERAASPQVKLNWRFQQALYRAYYDAYIRARLVHETQLEKQAMDVLRKANESGAKAAMDEAEKIMNRWASENPVPQLRARVFELAEALFQSIRMQLSVSRYQAIELSRGANLDAIDFPLNNRQWLGQEFSRIRKLKSDAEQLKQIQLIVDRTNPGPGGFYDDLGDPAQQPHLVRGDGWELDPGFYRSSLCGFAEHSSGGTSYPTAWWTVAETMFDNSIRVHYDNLDPQAHYAVGVVYGPSRSSGPVRLTANYGIEIHPYITQRAQRLDFDIPPAATAGGTLDLTFTGEQGRGGAGRNFQVAEVWLEKKQ